MEYVHWATNPALVRKCLETSKDAVAMMQSTGYLGNREMQKKYLKTDKLNAAAGGTSLCTGDGIDMGLAAGAAMEKTFGYCPCEYGGTNTKATRPAKQDKYDQNLAFKFGLYGNLLVDAQGKRFINEGLLCDYPMSHGSEQILHNSPWYGIVDQAYVDAMKTEGLYYCGTDAGSLYHSPYYDIAGSCYGLCIDSGYIAGNEAAAESKA